MARASLGPPVAGAYICPTVTLGSLLTNHTVNYELDMPAGMAGVVVGISAHATGLTSTPTVSLGTAGNVTAICTSNVLTNNAAIIFPDGGSAASSRATVAAGTPLTVSVVSGAAEAADGVTVGIWMYITSHANNTEEGDGGA